MVSKKKKEQSEPDQAETTLPEGDGKIKVRLRTALWQGKRIDQRRRADVVAFAEWTEILVSPEQLEALKADEFIEVLE